MPENPFHFSRMHALTMMVLLISAGTLVSFKLACVVLLPPMRHVYDAHRVGLHYNPAKFLVDHEGNAFKRYTGTAPNDMIDDIEALLKKKEESS
jgi:hypothetical protein